VSRCRRNWFEQILRLIGGLRPRPASRGLAGRMRHHHGSVPEWGKGQMDGSGIVLDVGHGGAMGKLCRPPMASTEPGRMLAFPPFQEARGEFQLRSLRRSNRQRCRNA
jgi:hypothetical protein